jgi:integrase
MARQRSTVPLYQRHSSGRARVRTYDSSGKRVEIILPGAYGSDDSKAEYARIVAQLASGKGALPASKPNHDCTIAELVLRYMEHAESYYVDPATKKNTNEVVAFRCALRPLCRLYGDIPAAEFGPLALQSLRSAMVSGSWLNEEERTRRTQEHRPIGLARTTCNRDIGRVKQLFKWASSVELIPAHVYHALATVAGLCRGRSAARETEIVTPVDPAVVEATLPRIAPAPADMVRVMLLSGCRVGELCKLRGCELDRTGEQWVYAPGRHKTRHRGHVRNIVFGPQAILILRKYLKANPDAYLFSPAEQARQIKEQKRANRKSKVQPSQIDRSNPNAKRKPGKHYTPRSVNRAIERGCIKANVERWHTHQLRHSAALNILREFGAEAARSALGHRTLNMTMHYAGIDLEKAKEVAKKIG